MLKKIAIPLMVLMLLAIASCKKQKQAPLITTLNVTNIITSTADCGGMLYAEGDKPVTEKGLCWGDAKDPGIDNNKLICGSGPGGFSGTITGLLDDHTYYIRAYAINASGVSYGKIVAFKTKLSTIARVDTQYPFSIKMTTASCGGWITSLSPILEQGVCYSTSQYPTLDNFKVPGVALGNAGLFQCRLTDLKPGTQYFVRAYAINEKGLSYGEQQPFLTYKSSVTDADGNAYMTVAIGSQVWMAENLKAGKFRDGTGITEISDKALWGNLTTGACCTYSNVAGNENMYGKLYNWYATDATATGKAIAPAGWHIPTLAEWQVLYNFCGSDPSSVAYALRITDPTLTYWGDRGGDYYRFSAMAAGNRDESGNFNGLNQNTGYWSSTTSAGTAKVFYMDGRSASFISYSKKLGFSIRCIKD